MAKEYKVVDRDLEKKRRRAGAAAARAAGGGEDQGQPKKPRSVPSAKVQNNPPHNILFLQNLPHNMDVQSLNRLFGAHAGYREGRLVPGKPGIGFVEYIDEVSAGSALEALQGFIADGSPLVISFSKK